MTSSTVLITGASSGIGRALAQRFAAAGRALILVARRESALQSLAQELRQSHGVAVTVIAHDLAIAGAAASLMQRIEAAGLQVDILVNNAGLGFNGAFIDSDLAQVQSMLQVDMIALTELCHLALQGMKKRGHGRILNVASVAAFLPCPQFAAYAACKAYVLSLSESLRHELRRENITVTCLCPGATATEFHDVAGNEGTLIMRMMDSPEMVAEQAYRATLAGRGMIISGWVNKPLPFFLQLLPRSWAMTLAGRAARRQTA